MEHSLCITRIRAGPEREAYSLTVRVVSISHVGQM
jgi:hypothetical protein